MIRLRADSDRLRRMLRRREVEAVLRDVPDDVFEDVLELGAGDGAQSRLIAHSARMVLCTDLNEERLVLDPHPKITYGICDAEDMPYEAARFDLIYSSNVFEHLPHPDRALSELHRVLRDDGVMVHVIPNRFWKLLQLALFYPTQVVTAAEIVLPGRPARKNEARPSRGNNLSSDGPSFLRRNIWPPVHGEYTGHVSEFMGMGGTFWKRKFEEGGFDLAGRIRGLPAHSPYRFGLEWPRRATESLGLSSCNGYVLTKRGYESSVARLLVSGR